MDGREAVSCPMCGAQNPDGFSFCGRCGTPLVIEPAGRDVRKTVTVVFSDLCDSTSLAERLDPESMRSVLARYFDEMRSILEAHGGTVEKFIGDAVMAVFGIPRLHEDDALRAVRAAAEMRDALVDLNKELERDWGVTVEARTGIETGEVVAGAASATIATGDAVNVAARLEQAASPGQVLLGEATYRLARDSVDVERVEPLLLKGKARAVMAFALIGVVPDVAAIVRRSETPFVGREDELRLLDDTFRRVVRDRSCALLTVLGAAGVGKTRVVDEFLQRLGVDAAVLRGRCLPYGAGITYWPIVEIVCEAADLVVPSDPATMRERIASILEDDLDAERVVERLLHVLGAVGGSPASHETFWAVRTFLEAVARQHPLTVVLDDLQWAEPTLLDLLDHVTDLSRDVPLLVVCVARPELLDDRPGWAGGKLNAASILLEPLTDLEAEVLLTNLLARIAAPIEARTAVIRSAEGNPLFAEQMVAMLVDEGLLVRELDRWSVAGDLSSIPIPASIQALLEARLDRLRPPERDLLERASIEGKIFHRSGLVALCADDSSDLDERLDALVRRELIRPDVSIAPGDRAYAFRHQLVRDAVYGLMPKTLRAELHERFADWLAVGAAGRGGELDEITGYHLERAYELRSELGPVDDRARELAVRAADRLSASGVRARERGDAPASINLLSRAVALSPADDRRRLELIPDLCDALLAIGSLDRALEVAEVGVRSADALGLVGQRARAEVTLAIARDVIECPAGRVQDVTRKLQVLLPNLERDADTRGLTEAWTYLGKCHWWVGRTTEGRHALERAIGYADASGEPWRGVEALAYLALSFVLSSTPVTEAVREIEAVLERGKDYRYVVAEANAALAYFAAIAGRFDDARRLDVVAGRIHEELGTTLEGAAHAMLRGHRELVAGDPVAAERELRPGCEVLEGMGARGPLSSVAGYLAQALARQGRDEAGEDAVALARDATTEDDLGSQILWRVALAEIRAHQGRGDEAEALAREAVAIARGTEWSDEQGETLLTLAGILRARGREEEAEAAASEALNVFERRENRVMAGRAREFLECVPARPQVLDGGHSPSGAKPSHGS